MVAIFAFSECQYLARETHTSLIGCYDFKTMDIVVIDTHIKISGLRLPYLIEAHRLTIAFEDDILIRLSCRLKRVNRGLPAQTIFTLAHSTDCKRLDRQRLNDNFAALSLCHEASHRLIDGATDNELESRIESILHIAKILV